MEGENPLKKPRDASLDHIRPVDGNSSKSTVFGLSRPFKNKICPHQAPVLGLTLLFQEKEKIRDSEEARQTCRRL
jgi:hypothetical protein